MPRVLAVGGRGDAFKEFSRRVKDAEAVRLLLVDSEGPVATGTSPWAHVAKREGDHWVQPSGVTNEQLHFMVESMETWLVADPEALAAFYGNGFKKQKLPPVQGLEQHSKGKIAEALDAATKETKTKGRYAKSHGFYLIGKIDPVKVRRACQFAERFFDELTKRSA